MKCRWKYKFTFDANILKNENEFTIFYIDNILVQSK